MTLQEKALEMHREWNGKLETTAKAHVNSREDLSIAYTPGVAEPCKVIAKDKEGSLHLHNESQHGSCRFRRERGPGTWQYRRSGRMPVMEGKAVLFKEFGGVNAVPICWTPRTQRRSFRPLSILLPPRRHQSGGYQRTPLL